MPEWMRARSDASLRVAAGTSLLLAVVLVAASCSDPKSNRKAEDSGPGGPVRKEVVIAAGACATRTYAEFASRADALSAAASQASADPTAETRKAAQDAWVAAMGVWEQADVIRFGPAADPSSAGGEGLRDEVYFWPQISRCPVEQAIAGKTYADPAFATTALVNARGLYPLEYVLFYEGTDNTCGDAATINTSGSWAAISATDLAQRKADYAKVLAADIAARAHALASRWDPSAGNFEAELSTAGSGSHVYTTTQMALNAVSDALFYLDTETKDGKLAKPLGLVDCANATCPEALESPFSHRSKDDIRNNLVGFRKIFVGCEEGGAGTGFDDLLRAVGSGDLADRMTAAVDAAIAAVDAVEEPTFEEALAKDRPSVLAVYEAIRALTDLMKADFVSVLDLELPRRVEGDND
jgi:uncharacterized protein